MLSMRSVKISSKNKKSVRINVSVLIYLISRWIYGYRKSIKQWKYFTSCLTFDSFLIPFWSIVEKAKKAGHQIPFLDDFREDSIWRVRKIYEIKSEIPVFPTFQLYFTFTVLDIFHNVSYTLHHWGSDKGYMKHSGANTARDAVQC